MCVHVYMHGVYIFNNVCRWMDGWMMHGCMDGLMNGQTDGWMDGQLGR